MLSDFNTKYFLLTIFTGVIQRVWIAGKKKKEVFLFFVQLSFVQQNRFLLCSCYIRAVHWWIWIQRWGFMPGSKSVWCWCCCWQCHNWKVLGWFYDDADLSNQWQSLLCWASSLSVKAVFALVSLSNSFFFFFFKKLVWCRFRAQWFYVLAQSG